MTVADEKILLSAEQVAERVAELGQELTSVYTGRPLTVLGVMTGGVIFFADLVRAIKTPLQLGVLHARSYTGTTSGDLTVWTDTLPELADRDVLIVDDIFDTGQTLTRVVREIESLNPRSVRTAVLLEKAVERTTTYQPDWVAFEIENEFVIGYGLDFNGEHRHRPDIAALPDDTAV